MPKSVFVTVGSTLFDKLVEEVTKDSVLKTLSSKGYKSLSIQFGKGSVVPATGEHHGVFVDAFRYKDSLKNDFEAADLVISHAGAGSCIETLEAKKPLIAVVNQSLMDNHQAELAEALADLGFCEWCYPSSLLDTLKMFDASTLTIYKPGDPKKAVKYIDSVFNFVKS